MSEVRIGGRPLRTILGALAQGRHYRAALNMLRVYPRPWREFGRYVARRGTYPYDCRVRTRAGMRTIRLQTPDDLLTVNEIFCRADYELPPGSRVVVDLGSNIGVSALYFLTSDPAVRTWLFEPDPRNVERLRDTLAGYEDRYVLNEAAVADRAGTLSFGVEPTGRYGGLDMETGSQIEVQCRHVNDVLRSLLAEVDEIDLIKIDTEGAELPILRAMDPQLLRSVRSMSVEMLPTDEVLHDGLFTRRRRGNVEIFERRGSTT